MMHPDANNGIRLLNELPMQFRSWLDFYDHLSPELLGDKEFQLRMLFNPRDYLAIWGIQTTEVTEVTWIIDRDYYLARVAEALLPARLTYNEYNAAQTELKQWPSIASSVDSLCNKVLDKVAKVASRK